jgi:hypothetical protein
LQKPFLIAAIFGLTLSACSRPDEVPRPAAAPGPAFPTVALTDVGAQLTMETAQIKGDWKEDGWFSGVGAAPVDGTGYGSYAAKGDSGTGSLTWAGAAPAGATAIAVPILTGPVATGSSFSVVNDNTGEAIATLSAPPPINTWKLWRVPLPANVTSIRLVALDSGTAWGEWTAVGTPHVLSHGH